MPEVTFEQAVNDLRKQIKNDARVLDEMKKIKQKQETNGKENFGEVMANLTLSYRHLEDASMRLGKVLQHLNGGVSIYDHNVVGDPTENKQV